LADLISTDFGEVPFLVLTETGDAERIDAHPDFRLILAINPAGDVGKRELPLGIRSRLSELFIRPPDSDPEALFQVVSAYLGALADQDRFAAQDITALYQEIKKLEEANALVDGANQKPHFSLRTLTRTLTYVVDVAPFYGLRRALYEGFSMSFLTALNQTSGNFVLKLIEKHILGKIKNREAILNKLPRPPGDETKYVRFRHYWIEKGPHAIQEQPHYIITPSVERHLLNLARALSTRRFPILLEGPTSSGKTR
jgi:midasin